MDSVPDIVDAVLIFLVFLSVLVWAVGLSKYFLFRRYLRLDKSFIGLFSNANNVDEADGLTEINHGRLSRICRAGLDEMQDWASLQASLNPEQKSKLLQHALKQQAQVEQTRMENGLSILASVGATAPFIGLFGTVWGIMNALKEISATGSASLDVVAGPIGEALIATAIGIAAAVPAVLAYNYFIRKVRLSATTMDNFATAFQLFVMKAGYFSPSQHESGAHKWQ